MSPDLQLISEQKQKLFLMGQFSHGCNCDKCASWNRIFNLAEEAARAGRPSTFADAFVAKFKGRVA
jgi:hypothetical protein